jgi:glyceraldehyde 3-phosphate dehydrogenase
LTDQIEAAAQSWAAKQRAAEGLIPLVGRLYRENDVLLTVYGRSLLNKSVTGIIKAHRYARHFDGVELDLDETLAIAQQLAELDLGPSTIDLGRLAASVRTGGDVASVLAEQLAEVVGATASADAGPRDVVLYGFGRIGRLLARILIDRAGGTGLRLRAIVVRRSGKGGEDIVKRASLLRRDSVHGKFRRTRRSSRTARSSRSSTRTIRRRSTTPRTASMTRSSSTTRASGAMTRAFGGIWPAPAPRRSS